MTEWLPMNRAEAQALASDFEERLGQGGTASISFQEAVRLREAWLVISGTDPAEIRRVLEEEWGTPLD
jgi:hypothetical protein